MADATIDRINPADLDLVTHLYNTMFRPEQDEAWIARRLEGRMKPLVQVARIDDDAVGFYVGYELKPNTHYTWVVGVVPELRRAGIASQLMHAAENWSQAEGYKYMRFECDNRIRPIPPLRDLRRFRHRRHTMGYGPSHQPRHLRARHRGRYLPRRPRPLNTQINRAHTQHHDPGQYDGSWCFSLV